MKVLQFNYFNYFVIERREGKMEQKEVFIIYYMRIENMITICKG